MPGKRVWLGLVGLLLLGSTGCCRWCERWCGNSHPTAAIPAYAPAANQCCVPCCPVPVGAGSSPAPFQAGQWQRNPACCP